MAEFCKDCFLKINDWKPKDAKRLVLSKDRDLCEGCGQIKPVVISIKKKGKFFK